MSKIITKLLFEAKKGDRMHLDSIYIFQGLGEDGGSSWWQSCDFDGIADDSDSDSIIILRDVKIEIKVTEWENKDD